jgi:hypothetical protein
MLDEGFGPKVWDGFRLVQKPARNLASLSSLRGSLSASFLPSIGGIYGSSHPLPPPPARRHLAIFHLLPLSITLFYILDTPCFLMLLFLLISSLVR